MKTLNGHSSEVGGHWPRCSFLGTVKSGSSSPWCGGDSHRCWHHHWVISTLDLMGHLLPQQIKENLSNLMDLVPSQGVYLLSSVDQPLKIARDRWWERITFCVTTTVTRTPIGHHGITSMTLPWKMGSCLLLGWESWRWQPTTIPLTRMETSYFEGLICLPLALGSWLCWSDPHKEGWRQIKEDQRLLGFHSHGGSTGEMPRMMLWLQTNKSSSGTMNLWDSLTS